jgi:hypothetical protein
MPLSEGKSKKAVSGNIRELLRKFRKSGTIGNTRPRSPAHARRIAIAAAMRKAGKSRQK